MANVSVTRPYIYLIDIQIMQRLHALATLHFTFQILSVFYFDIELGSEIIAHLASIYVYIFKLWTIFVKPKIWATTKICEWTYLGCLK